ncbi:Activating signal cointegrator 1 complex subunit 2 [Apodemus speciosus]|uniref:Activating signal cointegrator 1 complex subunit 2 n=1 Tax=Apodemus speciosus TaxID=105296 RepID=A0ABQ0F936_APOSI
MTSTGSWPCLMINSGARVIFDETLQKCLDSYLHYVPRKFDEWAAPTPEVADMQKHLHRSVFPTFLRMSTHKESKDHFISPSAFGEILYNNFLFDIPKILDLCVLFGKGNAPLLQKMIGNIFTQQPSYYNDLDETIPTILQCSHYGLKVFNNILQHCGLQGDGTSTTPQKLGERGRLTPSDMPLLELKDVALYLCDTSTTLWAFLDIFPLACQTFQKHDFCYRLASFYEMAIPEMESAIKKRRLEDSKLLGDMWQRLSHSKKKLMEVFHIILNQICLLPILESSCDNIQGFIEEFLQIFSSLLQEKRFLRDYDTFFPVAEDISLLQQASSAFAVESAWEGVDRQKIKNIKDPSRAKDSNNEVTMTAEPVGEMPSQLETSEEDEEERESLGLVASSTGAVCTTSVQETPVLLKQCMGAAAALGPTVSGVELDSLISQVKDLLPDLGEGFILACLEHYSYDSEQVINNILEHRLAPELSQLDRGLERQVKPDPTPLLSSRHNVFQNDEFDVFSRDSVDLSRVHKGRRWFRATIRVGQKPHSTGLYSTWLTSQVFLQVCKATVKRPETLLTLLALMYSSVKEENVRSLVNDKQAVVAQWQRYQKYSVVVEEVPLQPGEYQADDYEDEYDDTYDGNQVGANDADSDDELISRRPFTIPQVLRTKMPGEAQEEECDEEDEGEEEAPKPDHFIQDPAVLREKAEARRMAFLARRGFRPENSTAVTGSPRGHGQSRETTQERRKKEANKAARANHSRRAMADRKRNKGMIPS